MSPDWTSPRFPFLNADTGGRRAGGWRGSLPDAPAPGRTHMQPQMFQLSHGPPPQRSVSSFPLSGDPSSAFKTFWHLLPASKNYVGSCLINHSLHVGCRGTRRERPPRDLQLLSERAFPKASLGHGVIAGNARIFVSFRPKWKRGSGIALFKTCRPALPPASQDLHVHFCPST